ncbi:MAG: PGPGW domain-containing protein [Phycisphaerae bacterium]|nr:PGPGW domain-containing protein [Phycisphaerae bacterium]
MRAALRKLLWPVRLVAGIILILLGFVMALPGVPGPGVAVMIAGVFVLAPNSRLAHWLRAKGHQARQWWNARRGEKDSRTKE